MEDIDFGDGDLMDTSGGDSGGFDIDGDSGGGDIFGSDNLNDNSFESAETPIGNESNENGNATEMNDNLNVESANTTEADEQESETQSNFEKINHQNMTLDEVQELQGIDENGHTTGEGTGNDAFKESLPEDYEPNEIELKEGATMDDFNKDYHEADPTADNTDIFDHSEPEIELQDGKTIDNFNTAYDDVNKPLDDENSDNEDNSIPDDTAEIEEQSEESGIEEEEAEHERNFYDWASEHHKGMEVANASMEGLGAAEGYIHEPLDISSQTEIVEEYNQGADEYAFEQSENQEGYNEGAEALSNAENEQTEIDSGKTDDYNIEATGVTFDSNAQYTYKNGELHENK